MRIIRNNFGLKVLSLALAVVGWAYFRFAVDPAFLAHFNLNPPPELKITAKPTGATNH